MLSSFTFFLERIGPSHKKFWELRNFKIYGKIIQFHTFFEKVKVVLFLIRTSFSLETYIIRYAFSTFIICRSPSDLLSKINNRIHSGVIIHFRSPRSVSICYFPMRQFSGHRDLFPQLGITISGLITTWPGPKKVYTMDWLFNRSQLMG